MVASIQRLAGALLAGFVLAGVALLYWGVIRAPDLVAREDNPRLVQAEMRVLRGRLLDRDGLVLAYSEARGPGDIVRRTYPHKEAAQAVGYYSLRYGAGGCEAVFDATLRGSLTRLEVLLHRPQAGTDVRLSMSLGVLRAADQGLGDRRGAVVALDVDTGEILALVSHPSYDANRLDNEWDALISDADAPLLNRTTQGVYPVGDLARWVGLTGLLSSGITSPPDPTGAPLAEMLRPLSEMGYLATAHQLGFDAVPPVDLPSSPGRLPDFGDKGTPRDLAVTPMHMVRFVAAVAGDGRMPVPQLGGAPEGSPGERVFAESVSAAVRAVTPQYGGLAGWVGVAQPEETGSEPLSWFVGYAPVEEPRYALVVVVEGSGDGEATTVPVAHRIIAELR